MNYVQQIEGFTIGYIREKAVNLTSMLRLVNTIQKPYRCILYSEHVRRLNSGISAANPNKIPNVDPSKSNESGGFVVARLQEPFEFSLDSKWVPLFPMDTAAMLNYVTQAFGKAAYVPLMTRRMWVGSSPLQIKLNLKFRTDTDAEYDVLQQVKNLQMMVCPGGGRMEAGGQIWDVLASPPGPSIYSKSGTIADVATQFLNQGDTTFCDIGEYFHLDRVLVTGVEVKFSNRMSAGSRGIPIAADATVHMESYEIMTKQSLNDAYQSARVQSRTSGPLEKLVDFIGDLPNEVPA